MKSHERLGEITRRLPIVQEKNIDKDRRRREAAAVKALTVPSSNSSNKLKSGIANAGASGSSDEGSGSNLATDQHNSIHRSPQQPGPSTSMQATRALKPATVDPIFVEAAINAARADVTGFTPGPSPELQNMTSPAVPDVALAPALPAAAASVLSPVISPETIAAPARSPAFLHAALPAEETAEVVSLSATTNHAAVPTVLLSMSPAVTRHEMPTSVPTLSAATAAPITATSPTATSLAPRADASIESAVPKESAFTNSTATEPTTLNTEPAHDATATATSTVEMQQT
jgi:hypothetical protein